LPFLLGFDSRAAVVVPGCGLWWLSEAKKTPSEAKEKRKRKKAKKKLSRRAAN
jgi:hypothetical protein